MQPSQCVGSLKSAEREEESAALPDRRTSANEKVSVVHERSSSIEAEFLLSMLLILGSVIARSL